MKINLMFDPSSICYPFVFVVSGYAFKLRNVRINIYIIDTEISSRKKDYVKMIRKMH